MPDEISRLSYINHTPHRFTPFMRYRLFPVLTRNMKLMTKIMYFTQRIPMLRSFRSVVIFDNGFLQLDHRNPVCLPADCKTSNRCSRSGIATALNKTNDPQITILFFLPTNLEPNSRGERISALAIATAETTMLAL